MLRLLEKLEQAFLWLMHCLAVFCVLLVLPIRLLFQAISWLAVVSFEHFANGMSLVGQLLWWPVATLGEFLLAWITTRDYRQMLWSLPALALLLPFVLVHLKAAVSSSASVAGPYQHAVKESLEAKDFAGAQFYERKLAQLGIDTKLTDYQTAQSLARDGKFEQAYQRMQRLAPLTEPGYPNAHFWILQRLLSGELDVAEDQVMQLTESHLQQIKTLGFKGPEIQLLQANHYINRNQLAKAAHLLQPLVFKYPQAAVQRMQLDLALQETQAARQDAHLVRMHMQDRHQSKGELTSQEFQWWADAESVLGDVMQLKSTLKAWLEQEPENPRARQSLAEIHRYQFQEVLHAPLPSAKVLVNLLIDATDLSSSSSMLFLLAKDLFPQQGSDDQRGEMRIVKEVVEQLVHSPRASASICGVLASAAVTVDKLDIAKTLLERAVELDASQAEIWNNYAWVLSHSSKKDLNLALRAVNRALEIAPDAFPIRETRGQILLLLERWPEAIADLEYAANGMPLNKEIHLSLADAFTALGEDALALVHRQHGTSDN